MLSWCSWFKVYCNIARAVVLLTGTWHGKSEQLQCCMCALLSIALLVVTSWMAAGWTAIAQVGDWRVQQIADQWLATQVIEPDTVRQQAQHPINASYTFFTNCTISCTAANGKHHSLPVHNTSKVRCAVEH